LLWTGLRKSGEGNVGRSKESSEHAASIKHLAWEHRDFAFYRAPHELISSATHSLPVIMLVSLFSPAAAGFYALGRTVLMAPAQLIGNSVRDVVYPKMADAVNNKKPVTGVFVKSTLALFLVGLIPY